MLNIILFGPPGAGKGTQSKKLLEKYKLIHLATGELLYKEVIAKTALGVKIKELMFAGKLVPDDMVISMIENKIKAHMSGQGFVLDGFPRTLTQAEALDELFKRNGLKLNRVIAMEVEEAELVKRILQRGKERGRFDDQNESIVRNRLETYFRETAPLADYYAKQDKFVKISGVGEIDEIFEKICREISHI